MFKLILGLLFGLFTLSFSYAQEREQMQSKARNFNTFEEVKIIDDSELSEYSSMTNHPEYATLPHNAPCTDCFEVLEERTQFSRKFLRSGKNGNEFLIQKGYSPLHYKNGNGDWITYDPRLKKENQKLYSVKNQFYDIQINTNSGEILFQNKNGNFSPIQFHKNLQLEKIDGSGNVVEVIQSNWTNYSAGNDGVKITDLFPNIDFEININGPTIKTNFIVKSNPGYEFRIKEELDHDVLNKVLNSGNKMNVLKLNENGQFAYRFSEIMIYDANSERNQIQGKYAIEGNELIYSWDHNEISNLQYPFIIDPTVTSSNTLPQASIIGSGLNNFGAFTQGCTYNLSVPTPANCTITDIDWTFSYIAQGGASMSEGACKFYYGACVSPATAGFFWFCNSVLGGTCNGANISIFADFATCVPAPQCNPYNMDFTMEFFDAFGGATCDPTFIAAASDWTMTITGETVDEPAPPTSSNGTSLCPGETTVLSATGVYGVPPYTYSWSPTTNLDDPNIQSPTFTAAAPGTYNYTCTITDACGITANNSISITVVNGPWAGTDGTLDICDNAAPVDLTASLGGSPDAGGYWTPALNSGGNTFDPAVDGAGVYTYTVEDAPGPPNCPDATATVTVNIITVSSAGNDGNGTLCNSAGSTLDLNTLLSGADPGGTWAETTGSGQFNTGTGVFNAAGLTAGTYSFTYSFPAVGGCPGDVANFDVVVNDQPAAGNDGNSTLCNSAGSNIDLNTLLSGADPGGTWAETTGSGQFNTGTGVFDASGLTAGTYSFTYTLTGTAPCIDDVADFDIVVSDQPEAGNDGNSTLCNSAGSTLDINTLLSGADPGGTWAETTGSGQFNTGTGVFDASGLTAGTYTFTYTITGTAPCTDDFATFDVVVNDQPDAGNDGNSTICNSVGSNIDLNTLLSGADPGGTWAETTTSGQFTPGTGVFDASSLTAGTYSFTYTLTGTAPCIDDVADFDIVVTAQPEAGNDGNSTLCNSAGSTLDLNTLLSGADAGGTWAETTGSGQFTPGTGVFDASGLTAGTYTFTYSFAASGSCLADFATFDVVVNDQPDAGNDGNSTICNSVGSTIDLNTLLSGADSGGTWAETTGSGQFTPGTGVFDASGLATGTYTFTYTITATAPCSDDFATFDVVVTGQPEAGNDGNSTLCNSAGSTLDLNTLLSGADPGGTWAETTGSGQFTPGTGVFDASGLTAGTYTFTYSFAASGSCLADFATFDVVVNDQPDAGLDATSTLCNSAGSTLDLNTLLSGADPGGTWAETTTSGQFTPGTGVFDASGLTAGTYTFTYTLTGTAPCIDDFATFDITVTGTVTAGNDNSTTICSDNGAFDVSTLLDAGATGGGTWTETSGTPSGQFTPGTSSFDPSGLNGTYTFMYTLAASGSCLGDDATMTVIVNPFVDAGADGTADLCNTAGTTLDLNTLLSGADPGGTWAETTTSGQFTPGTGIFDASGLAAGTYTFTYTLTSAAPCGNSVATFDINVGDQPDAGLDGSSALCNSAGSTLDLNTLLNGADPGGTWAETTSSGQFNTGTGVFDASGLTAATYTFTYTLTGNAPCVDDVATFDVSVTGNVTAGADNSATICSDNGAFDVSSLLDATATGGGTWSETSGTPSGQFNTGTASLDPTGLNGVYTFMYTLTASGSCLGDDATMTITVNPAANAGADGNSTICNDPGSTIDLNTLLSGASPGGTWAETSGSGQFTPGTGIFDASGLTAGTYNFTYTITGTAPCVDDVANFVITVTGTPDAGLDGTGTLCNTSGSTINLNTLLSGADPGGTWAETTSSGQFNTGTGLFDASGLAGGVYTFEYTVGGTGSCPSSTATFNITVTAAPPAPTLGGGGTYCENTNASLTATGTGGTISWYTDPGLTNLFQTGSPITFTVPLGTSVFYVVEDNGCQGAVDTISVTGIAGPTLNVPPLVSGCEGDVLTIDATSNSTVLWSTGDTSLSITVTATVDTFVVATVFSSCDTLIDTTFINVFPGFDIDAGPDQTLPLGASTTIEATSTSLINGITWSPSTFLTCPTCVSTDVNATQTVTYLATAVDENGCIATDTVTITIDGEITIYIPNIFSPNNDGENDDFGPYGPNFKTFTMEIYDRWGAMIWSTEEPNVRWDGKHKNGDPCPQAVFVYRIRGEVYTGQIIERSGNVMLTR